jgi:LacI family transcriptional regulator
MVTIKDIAKLAGVTFATVSRALNNESGVSEEMRSKIVSIAKELRYVPNIAAKRLVDKQSNCIGFVFSIARGAFFNHLCDEFQKQGKERGCSLLVSFAAPETALTVLQEHFIQRVVLWAGTDWVPSRDFLNAREMFQGDIIMMGGGKLEGAHRVTIDRKEAIYKAVQHLAELGHRRIAYVGLDADDKLVGYTFGLLEYRLEYTPRNIISSTTLGKIPEDRLADVLNDAPERRPTAFVVSSAGFLKPFLRVVRQLNLRIPEHFSLIVYDNIPEMEDMYDVSITTVGPNVTQIVSTAMDIWSGGSQEGEPAAWKDITIPSELTVRSSTIAFNDEDAATDSR